MELTRTNGTLIEYATSDSMLLFYGDTLNGRPDFLIRSNCAFSDVKVLLFFDSRGISRDYNGSVVEHIIQKLEADHTGYLLVSRPLEITTWMTLYNFMCLNALHPNKIITNMGFVDYTPKKMEIINKSTLQYNCFFSSTQANVDFVECYPSSSGEELELFMQHYPAEFTQSLSALLKDIKMLVFNTPLLVPDYSFERARPVSFFDGVRKGNEFNHMLGGNIHVFDFAGFTNEEIYDAVHYTNKGMELLYRSIRSYL